MGYMDRFKGFQLRIKDETFDDFAFSEWTITHTLNNKLFTFSEFIEAYVSKRETNGFSISFSLTLDNENYDVHAEKFRKALQSKEKIFLLVPLGLATEFATHLTGLNETWNTKDHENYVTFDIELHTTIDDLNLPSSVTNTIEQIESYNDNAKEELNNKWASLINDDIDRVNQIVNDVKAVQTTINTALIKVYKRESDLLVKANSLSNFIQNIAITDKTNLTLISSAYNELLDLPSKFSDNIKKDIAYFKSIEHLKDKDSYTDDSAYEFGATSFLRANANNNKKLINNIDNENLILKKDVLQQVINLNFIYFSYIEQINSLSASSIRQSSIGFLVLDKNLFNSLKNIISVISLNIEDFAFNFKVENSLVYNQDIDFYVFANQFYDLKSIEELENKVDEIIKINEFKGFKTYGIPRQTTIKYLT